MSAFDNLSINELLHTYQRNTGRSCSLRWVLINRPELFWEWLLHGGYRA